MSHDVRVEANLKLGDQYLEFLQTRRNELYRTINETREALDYEDGERRVALVAAIKRVGAAIEDARKTLAPYEVVMTLIDVVQGLNMARHENREVVKELAREQSVNKAMLAEINREISRVDEYFVFNTQFVASPFETVVLIDDHGPFYGAEEEE